MSNNLDIDIMKLTLPNGRTLEKQMKYEAKRFLKILQEEIDRWYSLYSPMIYQRTYDMRNSIYAEDLVRVSTSGNKLQIKSITMILHFINPYGMIVKSTQSY